MNKRIFSRFIFVSALLFLVILLPLVSSLQASSQNKDSFFDSVGNFFLGKNSQPGYFSQIYNGAKEAYSGGKFIGLTFYFFTVALKALPIIGPVMANPGFKIETLLIILSCVLFAKLFMWMVGKLRASNFVVDVMIGPVPIALFYHYLIFSSILFSGVYLLATILPITSNSVWLNVLGLACRAFFGIFFLFPIFQPWSIFSRIAVTLIFWFFMFKLIKKIPFIGSYIYEYFEYKINEWEKIRIKNKAAQVGDHADYATRYWDEAYKAAGLK